MPHVRLRRHAMAPVLTAVLVIVPLGMTTAVANATTVSTPTAPTSAAPAPLTAPATKTVAPVAKKPVKKLTKKQKHKRALKKAAKRKSAKRRYAHHLVENKYKWSHRQYTCLRKLWHRESGWRVKADNPYSSAYGIPQALPGHKMGKGWRWSAKAQIRWGLRYIDGRYGSPCKANHTQLTRGWY